MRVIGTDYDNIVRNVKQLIEDDEAYQRMSQANNPYGDGQQVPRRICEAIEYYFGLRTDKPDNSYLYVTNNKKPLIMKFVKQPSGDWGF